jgi:hypothetical protein
LETLVGFRLPGWAGALKSALLPSRVVPLARGRWRSASDVVGEQPTDAVRQCHQQHTRGRAHGDDGVVHLGPEGRVDDGDTRGDEHLRAISCREEAVADGDGSFDGMAAVVCPFDGDFASTDTIHLACAGADEVDVTLIVVSHEHDRVAHGVRRECGTECQCQQLDQAEYASFTVNREALDFGRDDERAARLEDVLVVAQRHTLDGSVHARSVEASQCRVDLDAAEPILARQDLDRFGRDRGRVDAAEGHPFRELQRPRDVLVDVIVEDQDAAEDGDRVALHHQLGDLASVLASSSARGVAVLDADSRLGNALAVQVVGADHASQAVDGAHHVGVSDHAARVARHVLELAQCQRVVPAVAVASGRRLNGVLAVLQSGYQRADRTVDLRQFFCFLNHGLAPFRVFVCGRASPTRLFCQQKGLFASIAGI